MQSGHGAFTCPQIGSGCLYCHKDQTALGMTSNDSELSFTRCQLSVFDPVGKPELFTGTVYMMPSLLDMTVTTVKLTPS